MRTLRPLTMDDRPQTPEGGQRSAFHVLSAVARFFLLSSFFLFSCSAPIQPAQEQTLTADSTSSARPWLNDLFACANERSVTVNVTADQPDIFIRIGEPDVLLAPAYQIGEEEIFIVVNRESPVQNLSLEEAQALFAGSGGEPLQAWVYPSESDLQGLFDQFVMKGRGAAASAKVAADPGRMSDLLNSDPSAAGILPGRWMTGNLREIYSMGTFPVLAILGGEPQDAAKSILACLQNDRK